MNKALQITGYKKNRRFFYKMSWFILLLLGVNTINYAQQDAQFTQFMFNKLFLNPAYSGSNYVPCISAIHRQQWAELEGAPISSAINFNTPLSNNRVGLGMTLSNDNIGPTNSTHATLAYAYRMHLKNGVLSLGLQGSIRQYRVKWNKSVTVHTGDGLVANANSSKLLPNAGFGLYYETSKFYLGASIPRLLEGDLSLMNEFVFGSDVTAIENRHFYAMTGYLFDLNKNLKLKPAILLKFVKNAPFDMDFNLTLIALNKIWIGGSYRLGGSTIRGFGESLDVILQYQVSDALRLGAAFDFTLSEIRDYSSGTFEFYAFYCLGTHKEERVANPRFF